MAKIYALSILLFITIPLSAKVIYVNLNATGQNNGTSWVDAFTNPNQALPTAQYGDEIWVAKGAYFPYPAAPVLSFVLVSGTKLLGGFNGTEITASQRDWTINETILYGDEPGFTWLNVIYGENTDSTTLLDGFTIRGGHADITLFGLPCSMSNGVDCIGGGISLYNNNPETPTMLRVRNCRFINNGALQGGGIAANFSGGSGGLIVEKCYFNGNGCNDLGGGIFIETGQHPQYKFRVDSCLFEYNDGYTATCISVGNTNHQLDLRISNSVFQFNKSYYSCAGVYFGNGSFARPVVENCSFFQNESGSTNQTIPGSGGALFGSNFKVVSCYFRENKANNGGAIAIGNGEIFNCVFERNWAKKEGGALRLGNKIYLINCTFIANKSGKVGGAIRNISSTQDTILNCIFVGNRAVERGNWLSSDFGKNYFANSMIDVANCDSLKEGLHPMYDTLTCGPNMLFNIDPQFRDTVTGDFRLRGCSPLINQGDSAWVARFNLLQDIAGGSRWQDGLPDIGAYETAKSAPIQVSASVTSSNNQNSNGSVVLDSLSGGTLPYQFDWSNGSMADSISQLAAGVYTVTVSDAEGCTSSWAFEVQQMVGIIQTAKLHNLLIYPNPARDWVDILIPQTEQGLSLEITDLLGKVIFSKVLQDPGELFRLNITQFDSGLFWVMLKKQERIKYVGQLIKQ